MYFIKKIKLLIHTAKELLYLSKVEICKSNAILYLPNPIF